MRIVRYKYKNPTGEGWEFQELEFKRVNLFVGDTATGKTRLLNTIFSLGKMAVRDNENVLVCDYDVDFEIGKNKYRWQIKVCPNDDNIPEIEFEKLTMDSQEGEIEIFKRESYEFIFNNNFMPKMSRRKTGIALLQNEEIINPIYLDFSKILSRKFSEGTLAKEREVSLLLLNSKQIGKVTDIENIFSSNSNLNQKLFLIKKYHPEVFREISEWYINIFPFIKDVDVKNIADSDQIIEENSIAPAFCIKEKGSNNWIFIPEFSSGMLKILIMLVDIILLPKGGISIIDEYENSLGINSIGFLPSLIYDLEKDNQFFISSHHPYIINEIPISNWYVFHRENMKVKILYGDSLLERYGRSNQSAFTKLINDDYFTEGIG